MLLVYAQAATSFINTGKHQEVCQYFINLKLVKKEIMKQLK